MCSSSATNRYIPYVIFKHIALFAQQILFTYPNISPKQLQQILQCQTHHTITRNYCYQQKWKYKKRNKQTVIVNIVNLHLDRLYRLLIHYISKKEAQIKPISVSPINTFESPYGIVRYQRNPKLLTTTDSGHLRKCILRLYAKDIFVISPHIHYHNRKRQILEFHVCDHDLAKFISNYLGLPYKSQIWFKTVPDGETHYISTDSSGIDICHLKCLEGLFANSLKGLKGKALLQNTFLSGKVVLRNEVVYQW